MKLWILLLCFFLDYSIGEQFVAREKIPGLWGERYLRSIAEGESTESEEEYTKSEEDYYERFVRSFTQQSGNIGGMGVSPSVSRVPHIRPDICVGAGSNIDILFAHPNRCDKYIQCVHGAPMVRDCGPGTYWDPRKNECGFWTNSYCSVEMKISEPSYDCNCNDFDLSQLAIQGQNEPARTQISHSQTTGYSVNSNHGPGAVPQKYQASNLGIIQASNEPPRSQIAHTQTTSYSTNPQNIAYNSPTKYETSNFGSNTGPQASYQSFSNSLRPVNQPTSNIAQASTLNHQTSYQSSNNAIHPYSTHENFPSKHPSFNMNGGLRPQSALPPNRLPAPINSQSLPAQIQTSPSQFGSQFSNFQKPVQTSFKGAQTLPQFAKPQAQRAPAYQNNQSYYGSTTVPHIKQRICQEAGSRTDVLFAHPSRCDKYIQCVQGVPMVRDCGPGTFWNPSENNCGHWQSSYCAKEMLIAQPTNECRCNDYDLISARTGVKNG
ncbi:uncharacterized protein LOC136025261 [Artemia franciscana]|uniref:Chitin-binding type-2 domain-containing protein n=1 Tax=Artemia franciscana TaxID=6661 RepID=A0AA88HQ77_ARTSF|nr:hypothetical protein QYM36_011752 [Artemia franciscana]